MAQEQVVLSVPGIHCQACVNNIRTGVSRVPGVARVEGDPQAKTVVVLFDPGLVSRAQIEEVLEERGFPVAGLGMAAPATGRGLRVAWGYGLLAVALAALVGFLGYQVGFLGFIYQLALPQAFPSVSLFTLAVVAGVAAFFSPCVFPLLPGYLAFSLASPGRGGGRFGHALALGGMGALGIVAVNLALGVVIAALGAATPFQPDPRTDSPVILLVRGLAGLGVAALGVLILTKGSLPLHALGRWGQLLGGNAAHGSPRGAFLYGLAYNTAGIGCTGPILLSLMLYSVVQGSLATLAAFGVFSLTMGGLMVGVTALLGLSRTALVERLRTAGPALQRLGAFVMIGLGAFTALSLSLGPGREAFVRVFLPFLP